MRALTVFLLPALFLGLVMVLTNHSAVVSRLRPGAGTVGKTDNPHGQEVWYRSRGMGNGVRPLPERMMHE